MIATRQQLKTKSAPVTMPMPSGFLQRKCACGNHKGAGGECAECASKEGGLQRKLTIGASNDPLELEADRVADEVLAASAHLGVSSATPRIQRYTAQPTGDIDAAPTSVDRVLSSAGRPLEPAIQQEMGQSFGHDFSRVRVHTSAQAEQSSRDVNANAYTVGHKVVFGLGQFAPRTQTGRRLLAHELTHVVQQTEANASVIHRSPDGDEKNKADDKAATKFVGCSDDQKSKIEEAIKQAEALASRAVLALEREYPLGYESNAIRANFGSPGHDQTLTIIARYKDILSSARSKTYKCAKAGKKVKEGGKIVDLCGQAYCPGTEITLFPDFGRAQCPPGPVVLHEAAHNTGACSDIDKGRGYPPAAAEDNAYSYEYFATDVVAGYKAPPPLKNRDNAVPRVTP
jgi:Domain of unknown function (DUF4157)